MQKILNIIIIITTLSTCTTKNYYNNRLKYHKEEFSYIKCKYYTPYQYTKTIIDDTEGKYCYIYSEKDKDCSPEKCPIFYISTIVVAPNHSNIEESHYNKTIKQMRFDPHGYMDDIIRPNSIDLHGMDYNGNFWRDISYNLNTSYFYCIGYKNIS